MTREEFEAAQQAATEKKKPQYEAPEWGGGVRQASRCSLPAQDINPSAPLALSETLCRLVQMKEREEKAEALRRVASKPFARSLADVDTELNLRGLLQAHVSLREPGTCCLTCS